MPLSKDPEKISSMFDEISGNYDRLNHILSFGIDRSWRRRLVRELSCQIEASGSTLCQTKVLDLACGTGDLSALLKKSGFNVVGGDFSREMLRKAKDRNPDIEFVFADAENLPFEDNSVDAVTICFGIRNFNDREKALTEIRRVLKPSGVLAIAEFSIPEQCVWRACYTLYFRYILPAIGGIVSSNKSAYTYLPESAFDFPAPKLFVKEIESAGFSDVRSIPMTGSVALVYTATIKKQH